jgi:hypothetical protein
LPTDICYVVDKLFERARRWRLAAILAPYLSTFLSWQSDLGHPAGDVLATMRFGILPKIWLVARIAARTQRAAAVLRGC